MTIPKEKLMKYDNFGDYAKDNHLHILFRPGDGYGSRHILKVHGGAVTHIGDVTMSGSLSTSSRSVYKSTVAETLSREFLGISISQRHILFEGENWTVRKEPIKVWSWNIYQRWLRKHTPIWRTVCYRNTEFSLCIQRIDFNVQTTSKLELPKKLVREKLLQIDNPKRLLVNTDVHFLKAKDDYKEKRAGFCIFPILGRNGIHPNWRASKWWDVPNDAEVISKKLKIRNFTKSGYAVYLPFVSLPLTPNQHSFTAMAFDSDDFLPNPEKRRVLHRLVKCMDREGLDGFFQKQKLKRHSWGSMDQNEEKSMSNWETRWLRVKAVTSHLPNSVLGQILLEADEAVLKFTLHYFSISANILNKLKIGIYFAVEILTKIGRLSLVSRLIRGKLKLSGKVPFYHKSFQRVWSTAFAAIEVNNVNSLRAAIALDKDGNQLSIRGERGITALGLAVINNRAELVQVLLEGSAKVDQPSWGDETALGLALQFGISSEIIKKLIKAGAKVDGHDLTGNSIRAQLRAHRITVQ